MDSNQISGHGESQTGPHRKINEDNYLVSELSFGAWIFGVADGVGGHLAGEVASENTLSWLESGLEAVLDRHNGDLTTPIAIGELDALLRQINEKIIDLNEDPEVAGKMATTLSCAWVLGKRLIIGQLGDSRIYRWRSGKLERLTVDHTEAGELFGSGEITEEEERVYPGRNKIKQAVGIRPESFQPSIKEELIEAGDRYLICSDGLSGGLWDKDIERLLDPGHHKEVKECAESLVDMAILNYGKDNTTAVVFEVE